MMTPVWNLTNLCQPPTVQCSYTHGQDKLPWGLISEAHSTLADAHDTLLDQKLLAAEFFLLQRSLYRANNALGKNKFMKQLQMVKKCVHRYINMKLDVSVEELKSCWQTTYQGVGGTAHHLASRQLLEYVLVRLMGAGHLLSQVLDHCVESYILCDQQRRMDLHVPTNVIFLSIVSRVWVLCRALLKQICKWYKKLYVVHPHLKGTQVEWLPAGTELPHNLLTWLRPNEDGDHLQTETFSGGSVVNKSKVGEVSITNGIRFPCKNTFEDEKMEPIEDLGLPVIRMKPEPVSPTHHGKKRKKATNTAANDHRLMDQEYKLLDPMYWKKQVQACTSFTHILACLNNFKHNVGCKQIWFDKRKERIQLKERKFNKFNSKPKAQRKIWTNTLNLFTNILMRSLEKKNAKLCNISLHDERHVKRCQDAGLQINEQKIPSKKLKTICKEKENDIDKSGKKYWNNDEINKNYKQKLRAPQLKVSTTKSITARKSAKGHQRTRNTTVQPKEDVPLKVKKRKSKKGLKRKAKDKPGFISIPPKKLKTSSKSKRQKR